MSNLKYIDCHTHAHFAAFKDDYKEVISRALEAGVAVVNVGTQRDTSARAVAVAHEFEKDVYAVVGLHPIHTEKSFHDEQELGSPPASPGSASGFVSRSEDFDYEFYKKLAMDPKTVAIGECGLDYYRVTSDKGNETRERQKEAFVKQIELAKDVQKPLMIHCRGSTSSPSDAFGDLIDILNSKSSILNSVPGVVHFFTGTVEDAKKLLDLGFYFTFGGVVTFTRSYDEVIKMIPMDRLLSETDAPYVTPEPYRGKRNEPAYVVYVVRKLAEIKGVSEEEMAGQIWGNARAVFRLR
ncbi:MAG: TatD family hydrolase [Candidatus Liptonbacteria bacterium]|nr:TatD family hydrolase [Candidatus Liptonbacteria bacterium]